MLSPTQTMTNEELLSLPVTIDLVTAGRAFGLGRSGAYELAARAAFPCMVLKVGRAYRVPRADLFRVLGVQNEGRTPSDTTRSNTLDGGAGGVR